MTRIVCMSDLHLDAVTHGVPRQGEIMGSVEIILEDVKPGDVVVCLGDVTDPGTNRSYESLGRAIYIDRKAKERGAKRVVWLVGNHDVLEDGSGGNVLEPLRAAGCEVIARPSREDVDGILFVLLPHAPLANRYDPEAILLDVAHVKGPMIVFGHLNPPGISPGSEADRMARGRDVMWPDIPPRPGTLYVGGHIHRAQLYRTPKHGLPIHIIGSPVRFDFGEHDHEPSTFVAEWKGPKWHVDRKLIDPVRLRRFIDCSSPAWLSLTKGVWPPDADDFVKGIKDSEVEEAAARIGATFVPVPKLVEAQPKAEVSEGAKKHRRVRDVVLDVAKAYPSAERGLLAQVEQTLTGAKL